MPCYRCGKTQTDPPPELKGKSPWARFVSSGEQKLICPQCQGEVPDWHSSIDRCPNCGSIRLSVMLDTVVCRECGSDFEKVRFE